MGGGDGSDDRKAEAESGVVGAALVVEALEGLKEPIDLVARNRRAGVGDPQQASARLRGSEYLDASVWPKPGVILQPGHDQGGGEQASRRAAQAGVRAQRVGADE